jgi:arylsulfatase A
VSMFERYLDRLPEGHPFLSVLTFPEIHLPLFADRDVLKECKRPYACTNFTLPQKGHLFQYVSEIKTLDYNIGKLLDILRSRGMIGNTLVFFSSDNGPETPSLGGHGSSGPLRGTKRTLFEGGHRFPALLSWPKAISSNVNSDMLASLLDIRPTIQDILRSENPSANLTFPQATDGESLLPYIKGDSHWKRKKGVLICGVNRRYASNCPTFAYLEDDWKIINEKRLTLYNLSNDISESTNVRRLHQNVSMQMSQTAWYIRGDISKEFKRNACRSIGRKE